MPRTRASSRFQSGGGLRIELVAADDRCAPGQIYDLLQGGDEHVVPLARGERADGEDMRRVALAGGHPGRIGARDGDHKPVGADIVLCGERARGHGRRDDDASGEGQRAALAVREPALLAGVEPGLEGQRMMDERNDAQAPGFPLRPLVQHAEGQAVDHEQPAVGQLRQPALGFLLDLRRGKGKAFAERQARGRPVAVGQPGDDPAIIGIAAGVQGQVTGKGEGDMTAQRSASYQPRAACDS